MRISSDLGNAAREVQVKQQEEFFTERVVKYWHGLSREEVNIIPGAVQEITGHGT